MTNRTAAFAALVESLRDQAERTAAHVVKARARRYAHHPGALETLHPGLASAPAGVVIAVAEHLRERLRDRPPRWFGMGGEVSALNVRAALLLGRTLRRQQRRDAEERTPALRKIGKT